LRSQASSARGLEPLRCAVAGAESRAAPRAASIAALRRDSRACLNSLLAARDGLRVRSPPLRLLRTVRTGAGNAPRAFGRRNAEGGASSRLRGPAQGPRRAAKSAR